MQQLSNVLPDFSYVIPDRLKPYAKFVVVVVIALIGVLVQQAIVDSATGDRLVAYITLAAGALGVLGTSNLPAPEPEVIDSTGREIALEVDE